MELKKYKLGEIAEILISSIDKKSKEGESPVRLCNFVDVYHNWAITADMVSNFMESTTSEKNIDRFSLKKGYVAFTKDSETRDDIGVPTYIAEDLENTVLGYHCALVKPDENIISGKFLNAFLHSDYIKRYFELNATGSGMRYTLSVDTLYNIPILAPSLDIQKRIGELFSNIDRKICINSSLNHYLEAMAKQLYDYWFVQFDFPDENGKPYKSSGGKMVWTEKLKREIPQGWSHGSLLDIANYTNGLACQKFRPTDERKLPVIKIKEMHDGFSSETEYVTADISESVKVYDGDVLFSWSASLEVMLWACGNGGLNQHIFKVTSKNGYPKSFYYYQLLNYIAHFKRMAEARKTTMGHITQEHLQQSIIVLPPDLTIPIQLEVRISPILEQIVLNNQEIIKLTRQRDELLPLLMNGQVSVRQLNNDLSSTFIIIRKTSQT